MPKAKRYVYVGGTVTLHDRRTAKEMCNIDDAKKKVSVTIEQGAQIIIERKGRFCKHCMV